MEEEIFKKINRPAFCFFLSEKIEEQDKKLEEIYRSIEKMRKYFLWTLVVTIAVIILPLIGMLFIIPQFLKTITGSGVGL